MKYFKFLTVVLFVILSGCNSDDDALKADGRNANLQTTGSSANDFLSAGKYSSLTVEIFYVEGFRPNTQTVINLKSFMEARLNKPGGISVVEKVIASPGMSPYSIDDIVAAESANRNAFNSGSNLTLFILFVDGGFEGDSATNFTLGTAYRNTSCVIFEDSIKTLSTGFAAADRVDLETTVLLHEICHLLGLVNLGSPMQNEHLDEEHDKHCNNENCLMFWEVETNIVMNMMLGGNVPELDANCIADLRSNGGK